ncbi:MAG: FkbM family methyltransferase [Lachnospiraceae bacterium]|nr:FkbM family methyltransferase [Lachnospiraceae bacterium]
MMDVECIKRIYNRLEDEKSKEIFVNRLLYSLTGDRKYMLEIINKMEEVQKIWEFLKTSREIYIFGAGSYGRVIIDFYKEYMTIRGLIDNDISKVGKCLGGGVPVVSFSDFLERGGKNAKVIISSRLYCKEMFNQLIEAGILQENILNLGELINNLVSRQYFDLPALNSRETDREVFIDGGCFSGFSSLGFIKWCNEKFEKIYAFEPDSINLLKCKKVLADYADKCEIIPKGLWDSTKDLRFANLGAGDSCISDDGNIIIPVTNLDEVVKEKVTFLKLDIEGAEYKALLGARKIIKRDSPRLAICVYHKPEDIWELPELLLDINPNYKFYFRHYSIATHETILYAV